MPETQVWSLVQEEPTGLGTAKPGSRIYWSPCGLETVLRSKRSLSVADTGEPLLATTTESLHAAAKNQHSQDKQLKGSTRARGAVIVTGSGAQGTVCRFVEGLPGQQRVRRRLPCETVMRTQAGRRQTLKPWQTFTGTIQIFLWTNVNFLCG